MAMSNLELQAILDASDSDSSEDGLDLIGQLSPSIVKLKPRMNPNKDERFSMNSSEGKHHSTDLERILMEHDDDDDDDDYDEINDMDMNGRNATLDDGYSLGGSTISTRPYTFTAQSPPHTNVNSATMQQEDGPQGSIKNYCVPNDNEKSEYKSPHLLVQKEQTSHSSSPLRNSQQQDYDISELRKATSPVKESHRRNDSESNSSSLTESVNISRKNHKPEDWAILQKILQEDDDDNDDYDEDFSDFGSQAIRENFTGDTEEIANVKSKKKKPDRGVVEIRRAASNASSTMDVDAILNAIDTDSDESDEDVAELDEIIAKLSLDTKRNSSGKQSIPQSRSVKSDTNTWKMENYRSQDQEEKSMLEPHILPKNKSKNMRDDANWNSNSIGSNINNYWQHYKKGSRKSELASDTALKNAEEYERRLLKPGQRDIVSPLMVKRRMKPKIELQTKSRMQQNHSTTKKQLGLSSLQSNQFNFSGMIDLKDMDRVSSEMQQSMRIDDVGLPTSISIGSKFIAVGTQRGLILVFDLFEELRQQLGLSTTNGEGNTLDQYGSVSSIDIASNGETLVAGYENGTVILWDIIKGIMVKAVSDMHSSPISIVRFISEKNLSVVSVDAGGLVKKLTFVKTMLLWSSVDNECLLDGSAGQILALDVLPPMSSLKNEPMCITEDKKKRPYHPSIHKLVLLALSSEKSSFAIAVEPKTSVLHRWPRPSNEDMNMQEFQSTSGQPAVFLPCLSWGWALVSGGENSVTPILARAWGCSIQLCRANFPPLESDSDGNDEETMLWPAFGVHDEFSASSPVLSLAWLGDRSLVFLTVTNELMVVDTVMMTLVERLDFSGIQYVYAEFALSHPATAKENFPDNIICKAFQNTIRSNEDRLLILGEKEVKTMSIVGIRERISALEEDGEWLEALALALDHFEFTIKSQEDRKRQTDGSRDLSSHPAFVSRIRLTEDEEWMGDLLLRYLTLAIDNAPETSFDSKRSNRIDLAKSHYQMLAGVCIEFCVVTRRLDLLFNEIYQCFRNTGYTLVFLEIIEPYVLNDKLKYIAPDVMSEFVENCKVSGDISIVERCLLHMDVTIMDFDSILSLLKKSSMYSALIHVYTQGLNDFSSPLQILFDACFDAADQTSNTMMGKTRLHTLQKIGYKIILYLRHCFTNKSFPTGIEIKPSDRVHTIRPELLRLLIRKDFQRPQPSSTKGDIGIRVKQFPYLSILMMLDTKALLDTLSFIFDDNDVLFADNSEFKESLEYWQNIKEDDTSSSEQENICPDKMDIIRRVAHVLENNNDLNSLDSSNYFHDFLAKYLLKGTIRAPPNVVCNVILRLSSSAAQEDVIKLLQVLPRNSYNRNEVLKVVEDHHISRAALILHKGGVQDSLHEIGIDPQLCAIHFTSAIDCYLRDSDPGFRREVFEYVKNECIGGNTSILARNQQSTGVKTVHDLLRNALCKKLPNLINLDPVPCAQLVAEIYVEELEQILTSLEDGEDEIALFKFLKAVISGDLVRVDAVAGPVLLANMTIDHHQKYLELMAKFHPDMVYHYLTNSDNYRVEGCLKLCQEYEIADASAYLLERMGSVSSALQLMLQTLEGRLMSLKRAVRSVSVSQLDNRGRMRYRQKKVDINKLVKTVRDGKEAVAARQILTFGLDLCERNSGPNHKNEHGSQLWFNVLDRLINAKGFLRLSKEIDEHAEIMTNLLNDLLTLTMQRMVPNVPLHDLVRKVTSDHAGSRLGELRELIATMLKTFASETHVCNAATNIMLQDLHKMSKDKHDLKARGTKVFEIPQEESRDDKLLPLISIANNGHASRLANDGSHPCRNNVESNSGTARLRKKRTLKSAGRLNPGREKIKKGMLTIQDKLFQLGESSDAAFMPRKIALLGEAEHFGRLR
ncbi:hypothetical protein CTEN210_11057 [Chaetoceros tenuissimus]|uniref:Vacuolar protein sorting-associated protein 8 central domain-containing protein n=1 Tax=Chaetoceros tenuissimus TaxID=426638 RepID=A0AAD3CYN4_9STRA|nr:hypothetical protein CTEN210_11057 [Chaetoceros tenuissimus]